MQKGNVNLLLRTLLIAALAGVFSGAKPRDMNAGQAEERARSWRGNEGEAGETRVRSGEADARSGEAREAGRAGDKLEWMTVAEAAGKLQQVQKPVLIDLYTTWCGWCKRMDKATYSNRKVIAYLNDKFYPVRVDAESKDEISWNGRTYHFDATNKVNEFAEYIAHGQLEFPTTIILLPGVEPMPIPGYMEPKQLEVIVKYFGEGHYGKIPFEQFQQGFKTSW